MGNSGGLAGLPVYMHTVAQSWRSQLNQRGEGNPWLCEICDQIEDLTQFQTHTQLNHTAHLWTVIASWSVHHRGFKLACTICPMLHLPGMLQIQRELLQQHWIPAVGGRVRKGSEGSKEMTDDLVKSLIDKS